MRPEACHRAGATLAVILVATLRATSAAAQVTTWMVPPVALDGQTAAETTTRIGELVARALAAQPELRLLQGARSVPDLSAARAALAAAREDYQKFQFAASERELERAIDLITRAGVPAGEAQTLIEALTELATVEETSGRHADAVHACEALMVMRPNVTLDPVRVPPRVMQACEAARRHRTPVVRSVTVSSTPPFRELYVDGQPLGAAPVTVTLPIGTHYLLCVGPDQQTQAQLLEIEPGSEQQSVHLDLPEPPALKLSEALRARLRRRGPRPQTVEAARALATVLEVERVIAGGVERDGADHWRLWLAAIDPQRHVEPVVAVARLADDLSDAPSVVPRMLAALISPRAHGGVTRIGELTAAVDALDFSAALFGQAPSSSGAAERVTRERAPARSRKAMWLWIGGAVAVAGAALTTGLLVGLDNGRLRVSW